MTDTLSMGSPPAAPPPSFPPDWAGGWGVDACGVFAEFSRGGIVQRMRWIGAGTFEMGSPKSEPERSGREALHEVTLTGGFWLADTACTQALWAVVMGENPSRFQGEDHPVEQVSWDDCQAFLSRLTEACPGPAFRLPTEAEWECACRAGTRTPFWFGETITTDQVNCDGNYPYAGGPKGEYRHETVSVTALPCNGWGLYQMHGNVWEWCQDWLGDYPQELVQDPMGPDEGDYRVCRGGSWSNYARNVRSAYRSALVPGDRVLVCGFRLARGQ